jgi:hypothetical protein
MDLLLDDCEVVSINRFSIASEPVLTISERHLWVNMACINILPDAVRVLFLLDRQACKLTLKPASEEKHSIPFDGRHPAGSHASCFARNFFVQTQLNRVSCPV